MIRTEQPKVAVTVKATLRRGRSLLNILGQIVIVVLIIPALLRSEDAPKAPAAKAPVTKAVPAKAAVKAADPVETWLFVTNADGSNPKKFTNLPEYIHQGSPEWSADGKLVCFDAWKAGGTFATGRIIVANGDGTEPLRYTRTHLLLRS